MLARALESFVRAVLAHRRLATGGALLAVFALALLASRVRLADNARALVADGDPLVAAQLDALSRFTAVDQLLIHLHSSTHPEQLEAAAEQVQAALEGSGRFARVRFGTNFEEQGELLQALLPRRFLTDERSPEELFAPAALRATLQRLRAHLLSPQGILGKELLLRDPFSAVERTLHGLQNASGLANLRAQNGRFYSADGHSLLVLATPFGNPFSSRDAEATMAAVDAAKAKLAKSAPAIKIGVIGAHRFARDAERIIRHDVHFSIAASIFCVLAAFAAFFRRVRFVLVAIPPLLCGSALAGALAGLAHGPVHGIVLAFAGACLGLAVDYTVHLVAATVALGGPPEDALPKAAQQMGPSIALAMATTVAGLAALGLAEVPALRQMGLIATGAVVGSFVGTLIWVPLILPRLTASRPPPPLLQGPWMWATRVSRAAPKRVLVIFAAIAVLLAIASRQSHIDGDLRNLDTHTAEGRQDEATFAKAFGDPRSMGLLLVEGADLAQALERADAASRKLTQLSTAKVLNPSTIVPSPRLATARRQRWCKAPGKLVAQLQEAGVAQGFRPQAFSEFGSDLEALCGPRGTDLLSPEPTLQALGKLLGRPLFYRDGARVRLALAMSADEATLSRAAAVFTTPEAQLIDRARLNASLVDVVARDLPRLAIVAFALVFALLLLVYRSLLRPLAALLPCILAVLTTFACFVALGVGVNLMSLCVFPLLAGLGIDYGVLMADAETDGAYLHRAFSLSAAAFTTLANFGMLALAHYYAIATIGQSVLIAVGSAALYALFIPVAISALRR